MAEVKTSNYSMPVRITVEHNPVMSEHVPNSLENALVTTPLGSRHKAD